MTKDILPPAARQALERGNKLEAIRQLHNITGLGLKEAKESIDSYERAEQAPAERGPGDRGGPPPPTPMSVRAGPRLSPGEVAGSGSTGKWLALMAVAAVAVTAAFYF